MRSGTRYRVDGDMMGTLEVHPREASPPKQIPDVAAPLIERLDGRLLRSVSGYLYSLGPPVEMWPVNGALLADDRVRLGLVCYGTPPASVWNCCAVLLLEKRLPAFSGDYAGTLFSVQDQEPFYRAMSSASSGIEDVLRIAGCTERAVAASIHRDPNA